MYHFLVHDEAGPIGAALRRFFAPVAILLALDTHTIGMCFVSGWMQIFGVLRMPLFFGPLFTPFAVPKLFNVPQQKKSTAVETAPTKSMSRLAQGKQSKRKAKSKKE